MVSGFSWLYLPQNRRHKKLGHKCMCVQWFYNTFQHLVYLCGCVRRQNLLASFVSRRNRWNFISSSWVYNQSPVEKTVKLLFLLTFITRRICVLLHFTSSCICFSHTCHATFQLFFILHHLYLISDTLNDILPLFLYHITSACCKYPNRDH